MPPEKSNRKPILSLLWSLFSIRSTTGRVQWSECMLPFYIRLKYIQNNRTAQTISILYLRSRKKENETNNSNQMSNLMHLFTICQVANKWKTTITESFSLFFIQVCCKDIMYLKTESICEYVRVSVRTYVVFVCIGCCIWIMASSDSYAYNSKLYTLFQQLTVRYTVLLVHILSDEAIQSLFIYDLQTQANINTIDLIGSDMISCTIPISLLWPMSA